MSLGWWAWWWGTKKEAHDGEPARQPWEVSEASHSLLLLQPTLCMCPAHPTPLDRWCCVPSCTREAR